jgi:hypothetical protein
MNFLIKAFVEGISDAIAVEAAGVSLPFEEGQTRQQAKEGFLLIEELHANVVGCLKWFCQKGHRLCLPDNTSTSSKVCFFMTLHVFLVRQAKGSRLGLLSWPGKAAVWACMETSSLSRAPGLRSETSKAAMPTKQSKPPPFALLSLWKHDAFLCLHPHW